MTSPQPLPEDGVRIRTATGEDAPALVALAVAFRDHLERVAPTGAEFERSIRLHLASEDAEFLVAEADGRAIGYLLLRYRHSMWANGTEATIEDLFVDPSLRRGGTGKALVAHALQRAAERGCTTACLDTNEFNDASNRIYGQLGFASFSKRWNGRQVFFRRAIEPGGPTP